MAFPIRVLFVLLIASTGAYAQLSANFYSTSCPSLLAMIQSTVRQAVGQESRMGASLLRLYFHDCFVNGCDGSVLLVDSANFTGEQNAAPNAGSIRGMGVIDTIKTAVERMCPAVVSCADILALAAREGTIALRGPTWTVPLGRRDARTASMANANRDLPPPFASLAQLVTFFSNKGLNARDMTALSGAHTIGQAQCSTFQSRLASDTNIDPAYVASLRPNCPVSGGGSNLSPMDVQTPNAFDNAYYQNLLQRRGLLHSDQELFNNGTQDSLVRMYATNPNLFASDFAAAMVKMGNISPLTGTQGEIRRDCKRVN